ncbi:BatA domain-containing protein [Chryseolinea lacunae]|uniref:BatA domain-containing protein n=1 Tax=Chryseolinea lacunae TaxID=2801331 RepID=A0ABS1KUB6_9BACT|nr:BatA domain-containing protein [Chryseolinea lacunae]MBL0742883.1 BatA domain-containing protein [Chryseolinea lacunae]
MAFTNPIWLWGLTGLLVPISIHLLSRKEGKVIRVGSIRHLEDSTTKQFRSLRLNELLLLLLRCCVIALVVLLLSGLHFNTDANQQRHWVVIEAGLEKDTDIAKVLDSLTQQGFEAKQLSAGFPPIDSATASPLPYWTAIEALKQKSLQRVVIISHNRVADFRGKRIALPTNMQWIVKESAPKTFPLHAIRLSSDSVSIRTGKSTSTLTTFQDTKVSLSPGDTYFHHEKDSVSIDKPDTVALEIASDKEFYYDQLILVASLEALKQTLPVVLTWKTVSAQDLTSGTSASWLIWLSDKKIPAGARHYIALQSKSLRHSGPLFAQREELDNASGWTITRRLNEDIALEEKLPLQLASILFPNKRDNLRAAQHDQRMQPEKTQWSTETQSDTDASTPSRKDHAPASPLLAFAAIAMLVTERVVAYKRNQ